MYQFLHSIRPQDLLDILIMSFLVYQLYSWFRNTKALQILLGLLFLGLLYAGTKTFGLFMTSWILQELGTVLFILIIVLFQTEIRQALYRFSLLRNFFGTNDFAGRLDFLELSQTMFRLASRKTGALVVFQRQEPVDEYVVHGVPLDSLLTGELLETLFYPSSPLHDGAVVVKDGRLAAASVHLPLSSNPEIPQFLGTRHRAALGLSECSDAVIAIVSEERGIVSIAWQGELEVVPSPETLAEKFRGLLLQREEKAGIRSNVRHMLFRNLRAKAATFCLVALVWAVITGRQGEIVTVTAPVRFQNLPDNLTLLKSSPEEVDVQLKVFSNLLPSAKRLDISADVDLSRIREGKNTVVIRNDNFSLPMGVVISAVEPASLKVTADKKIRKQLQVRPKLARSLGRPYRLNSVKVAPPVISAEGPESVLRAIDHVQTEEIDLSAVRDSATLEKKLVPPVASIKLPGAEGVKVTISTSRK